MADEWTVVTKKSKIKPFKLSPKPENKVIQQKEIQEKLPVVKPYMDQIVSLIPTTKPECVCFGIGNISQKPSQYQLALLLLLKPYMNNVYIFDPIMTANEIKLYKELGLAVLDTNHGGKYKVQTTTVFYMPHCDNFLYDAVLEANAGHLQLINILGNSFQTYKDMLTELPYRHLRASFDKVAETKVEINIGTAFNNFSWHSFNQVDKLQLDLTSLKLE
ncbi:sensitivity to red-light reduced protein [Terramyces sp. JEL0728]|nr:sensitivity to red-light reduced protein [Terramyces sp. JEL0728]